MTRTHDLKGERVAIDAVRPHPQNARQGDVGAISESLRIHGQYRPIVVQKATSHIVAGNHTWQAAQSLGWKEIDVTWIDVDNDEALRILLVDNRSNDLASYDDAALAELLKSLADDTGTLEGTGFDGDDLDKLLANLGLESEPPEAPEPQIDRADELRKQWGVEYGQLWEIPSKSVEGNAHRLLCGDSTQGGSMNMAIGDKRVGCMVFDPPWDAIVPKPPMRDSSLVFADGRRAGQVIEMFGPPTWMFVWDCVTSWYTPNRPLQRIKLCLWYGTLEDYNFDGSHYGEAAGAKVVTNTRGSYYYSPDVRGKHLADLFQRQITAEHHDQWHKHQKPLDWIRMLLANCSQGDVYDPFIGSGTTMLACEQLERLCYGVEIDPAIVAVTLERCSQAGLEPVLVGYGRQETGAKSKSSRRRAQEQRPAQS